MQKEKTKSQKAQETALAVGIILFCLFADSIFEIITEPFK